MIYHYTTIETLALILEYKKLRFTRLDLLDDSKEFNLYKSFPIYFSHYVSCWTENAVENIPLWKMYTSDMHGIRIGLESTSLNFPSLTDPRTMYYPDFFVCATDHIRSCFQRVQYLGDHELEKTISEIVQKTDQKVEIGKGGFGVGYHKSLYWKFQDESRFILQIFSLREGFDNGAKQMIKGEEPKEKYFDIPCLENAFSNMEIVLGPKCTPGEALLVKALVKAYNVTCEVKESVLTEIIRKS